MAKVKTRCLQCGRYLTSRENCDFHGVCERCFDAMSPNEKVELQLGWTLRHDGAENQTIDGHSLICPLCGHNRFWKRKTVLITPAAAAWNFLWASKKAVNYICDQCGYIFSFLREPTKP